MIDTKNKSNSLKNQKLIREMAKSSNQSTKKSGMSMKTLILLLASFQVAVASPYQLASQYLGSQGIGDEPVLLVKLPRSISSQMQTQLQQRDHSAQKPTFVFAGRKQYGQIDTQELRDAAPVGAEQTAEDPSISLTIPLSSLTGTNDNQQTHRQVVYMVPQSQPEGQRHSGENVKSGLDLDSPIADFVPEESSGHEIIEQKQIDPLGDGGDQQPISFQQQEKNLTSAIEQQVRKFFQQQAEQQYTTTGLPILASQPTTTVPGNQQLMWLNTQQEENQNQLQQIDGLSQKGPTDTSSLLAKLASSSPELLLRLKSLLRKAAQQRRLQQLQSVARNASLLELDMAQRNSKTKSDLPDQYQINRHSLDKLLASDQSPLSESKSQHLLSTFLASNNLSSHEEIKIPLVVIAMPRIVSLRRNHQKSMDSTPPSMEQRLQMPPSANYTHSNATANSTHLVLSQLHQHASNFSLVNSTTPSLASYLYLTNGKGNHSAHSGNGGFTIHQHVLGGLNGLESSSHHTRAPYARQFGLPVATPLGGQPRASLSTSDINDRLREQAIQQLALARQNQTYAPRQAATSNILVYPASQSALSPTPDEFVINNRTNNNLRDMQIRLIDASSQRDQVQQHQQYDNSGSPALVPSHQYQPEHKTLYPVEQPAHQAHWDAPMYMRGQTEGLFAQNSSMPSEDSAETRLFSNLAQRYAQKQQPLRSSIITSDERLARLRPIFATNNKRRNLPDVNKFGAEQMLNLLPRFMDRVVEQQTNSWGQDLVAAHPTLRSLHSYQRRSAEPDATRRAREKLVVMFV